MLTGAAPELAAFYPSVGGNGPVASAWPVFRRVVRERADVLRPLIARPLQTNEVGRCAALLPGFAAVARATGLPLRVLELGASAGLNLNWDRYRYERSAAAFGPRRLPRPSAARRYAAARTACRRATGLRRRAARSRQHPDDRLTLRACLWPDQTRRRALLDAALTIPVPAVDRADAPGWLSERLAEPLAGAATVVVHSIVWQIPRHVHAGAAARAAGGQRCPRDGGRAARLAADGAASARLARTRRWPSSGSPCGRARTSVVLGHAGYHGVPVRLDTLPA